MQKYIFNTLNVVSSPSSQFLHRCRIFGQSKNKQNIFSCRGTNRLIHFERKLGKRLNMVGTAIFKNYCKNNYEDLWNHTLALEIILTCIFAYLCSFIYTMCVCICWHVDIQNTNTTQNIRKQNTELLLLMTQRLQLVQNVAAR